MRPHVPFLFLISTLLTGCPGTVRVVEPLPVERRVVATGRAPAAIAAYSQAVQVGNTLYLAGQIGLDPATRQLVPGGIRAEARQALENCKAILEAAGFRLQDVVQVQVLLADIGDYAALNEIYVTYFPKDPPARAAYAVAALPAGARVEILMTAVRTQ
jgi:2-iminobutanoate/2-iminopropanoate deaminase